jgi:hypothetical protein
MGEERRVHRVLVGKPEGKRLLLPPGVNPIAVIYIISYWGDPDIDGKIILRWIFRKLEGVVGTGWSWLRIGTGGGHL